MVRIGKLNKRIRIQAPTRTRDAIGGSVSGWETCTTRWGSVEPLAGKEVFRGNQVDSRLTHKVWMRYDRNIRLNPDMRLIYNGRILNIHSVANIKEADRFVVVMCIEDTSNAEKI